MIEDQRAPKRCGHTRGKEVVERAEALTRIRAAVDARERGRADPRDGAHRRARHALARRGALARARVRRRGRRHPVRRGAARRARDGARVPRVAAAADGEPRRGRRHAAARADALEALGYRIAAYPLTLLSAATRAMQRALDALRRGDPPTTCCSFAELRAVVGFDDYDAERLRYAETARSGGHVKIQAIAVTKIGGPESAAARGARARRSRPGPGADPTRASGVNYIDVYFRTGLYPRPVPFVAGLEGAGEDRRGRPGLSGAFARAIAWRGGRCRARTRAA
jgi:hypothetical protein